MDKKSRVLIVFTIICCVLCAICISMLDDNVKEVTTVKVETPVEEPKEPIDEPVTDEVEEPDEDVVLDEEPEEEGIDYIGDSIMFGTADAILDEEDMAVIDNMIKDIPADSIITITVDGYTDSKGNYDSNMILSENRAVAVAEYIRVKYGISDEQIKVVGHSEDNPVGDNESEEGRALNRRVDILIKMYPSEFIE